MALQKGRTNNPNGRPVGSKNKRSSEVRAILKRINEEYMQGQFMLDWMALEPRDRIVLFERLLRYTTPTIQAIEAATLSQQENQQLLDKMSDEKLKRLALELINDDGDEYEETTD